VQQRKASGWTYHGKVGSWNGVWLSPKAAGCVCRDVPGTACDHCTVWQQQHPLRVLRRLPQRQRRPLPVAPPPPKPTSPVAVQTRRQSSRSTKGQRLLPTQYPPHLKPHKTYFSYPPTHPRPTPHTRGAGKKKSVTPAMPVVSGWVRGEKRTRVRFFFDIYFMAFLYSPHRETPKNVIKKSTRFFCKKFLLCF
jgi:hypothetical protein